MTYLLFVHPKHRVVALNSLVFAQLQFQFARVDNVIFIFVLISGCADDIDAGGSTNDDNVVAGDHADDTDDVDADCRADDIGCR